MITITKTAGIISTNNHNDADESSYLRHVYI